MREDASAGGSVSSITRDILTARNAIRGAVYRTPFERSAWLSEISGADVSLKLECYQPTGSFKVRGAVTAIARLDPTERSRGVITASAGNHGLGLAYAAQRAGVAATVVVPDDASEAKVAALQRFPLELLRGGPTYDSAETTAHSLAEETGKIFISPYNHRWVIAGQGTIGIELLEDEPELDVVLVPVGGGGLISGIGSWLKAVRPEIRVIGVQAAASPSMESALAAGKLVPIPVLPTLADGLAANIESGSRTFRIAREVIDEMVLIPEEEIAAAIRLAFRELHLVLEGSAVVGLAALLSGRVESVAGKRTAVVITGRNIAASRFLNIVGMT